LTTKSDALLCIEPHHGFVWFVFHTHSGWS
jgi:hypothetical protein